MTPVSYSSPEMGLGIETGASEAIDRVAHAFVEARRAKKLVTEYPGVRPQNLAVAYAIQDRAIEIWGDRPVGGWKVGRINSPDDALLGADRLSGPIFRDAIFEGNAGEVIEMTIFPGGFAAGESEFMLRLLPLERPPPTTNAETLEWIDEVRIGIEIASSPYPAINSDGPCVTVSDHGNNAGLLLGAPVPRNEWGNLTKIEIASFVDDTCVGRKTAASMLDGPLGAVRFLLANLSARKIPVERGWWVSSGAVTGVHEVAPGQSFRGMFLGVGAVECRIAK